jgi:hypothetical protein
MGCTYAWAQSNICAVLCCLNVLGSSVSINVFFDKKKRNLYFSGTMSLMSPFPGMDLSKMDPATLTLLGAAGCVMLTMHFTVQLVSQHLFYWKNPKEQKAILIIVLMAPLYAISSFVGLLDIQGSKTFFTFLDAVKECYEALVSLLWVNQILIGLNEACYFTNTCIFSFQLCR